MIKPPSPNHHFSNGQTACKCDFNKLSFEAEQKIEKFKASLSQAPIMEAKQLHLQILNDRSFLMEKS